MHAAISLVLLVNALLLLANVVAGTALWRARQTQR